MSTDQARLNVLAHQVAMNCAFHIGELRKCVVCGVCKVHYVFKHEEGCPVATYEALKAKIVKGEG